MTPDIERYLRITFWARRRYTVGGVCYTYRGGQPTRYERIENLAARKYLGVSE